MLKRQANYWKPGRAHFDDVELLSIADTTARMNALVTGAVDAINRVDLKTIDFLQRNKSIALEEGPYGLTCNAICIGDIRDKNADRATARARKEYRNPTTRPGSWEDVGDAVAFLAGDEASFVNGAVLTVGGGWQGFFADYARWH